MRRDLLTKGNWGEVNTECCEHGLNERGTFFDSVMSSTLTHHGSGRFIHRSTGYFIDRVITSTNCFVDRSLRRQAISSTLTHHGSGSFRRQKCGHKFSLEIAAYWRVTRLLHPLLVFCWAVGYLQSRTRRPYSCVTVRNTTESRRTQYDLNCRIVAVN